MQTPHYGQGYCQALVNPVGTHRAERRRVPVRDAPQRPSWRCVERAGAAPAGIERSACNVRRSVDQDIQGRGLMIQRRASFRDRQETGGSPAPARQEVGRGAPSGSPSAREQGAKKGVAALVGSHGAVEPKPAEDKSLVSRGDRIGYRLEWRLVGRASRLLDAGEIDGDFADRTSAYTALNALLLTYALTGRNEAEGYWWGRRSQDADMEIQLSMDEHRPPAPTVKPPARAAGREPARRAGRRKCSGPSFGPATPQEANWQGD